MLVCGRKTDDVAFRVKPRDHLANLDVGESPRSIAMLVPRRALKT
jgi:hypothetical protein